MSDTPNDPNQQAPQETSQGKPQQTPQQPPVKPPMAEGNVPPLSHDGSEERELWADTVSPKFFGGQIVLLILIGILLIVGGSMLSGESLGRWPLWIALGIVGVWLLVLIGRILYCKLARRYRLTNRRLFVEEGILVRTVNQTDMIRVNDVTVTQKLLDRVFNVGSVTVESPSDPSHPKILIMGIDDPHRVAELIHREMQTIRDRRTFMMEAT